MKNSTSICVTASVCAALLTSGANPAQADMPDHFVSGVTRLLYQEGAHVEAGTVYQHTEQSGSGYDFGGGFVFPGTTGVPDNNGWTHNLAIRGDFDDRLSYALVFDEPYAIKASFGTGTLPIGGVNGSNIDLKTQEISAILSYDVTPDVMLFGGFRSQMLSAIATYQSHHISTDNTYLNPVKDSGAGYLLGAAYEKPDETLRLALTYHSEISHSGPHYGEDGALSGYIGTYNFSTPQRLQFDFQVGAGPQSQIFGFVRWTDGSEGGFTTQSFAAANPGTMLAGYADDFWTFNVGYARQLSERVAGAVSVTYEPPSGATNVAFVPYDGLLTGTLGLSYEVNGFNVTGTVSYTGLGDTEFGPGSTQYDNGYKWSTGLRVSYDF